MRVLIADDDSILRHALARQLAKWNFEPVPCSDGLQVREMLQRDALPPLGLIDWNMPGVDGLTLCREIRSMPDAAHVYLILITSNRLREDIVSGLTSGANDYVVKPFDWAELHARVHIGARTVTLQNALQDLSLIDELTGLHNRRGFVALSKRHLTLARRKRQPLLLIAADVDDLKFINDRYGHAAGDQAIVGAATVLRNTFRSADIIARVGGDEFLVFPIDVSPDSPAVLLERLKASLDAYNALRLTEWPLSISIGVAHGNASDYTDLDQLLEQADGKLYAQKRRRIRPQQVASAGPPVGDT